ncbi:MAG: substrate-binding domain-containing protein [Pseudomonadota bacterium]
MAYTNTDVAPFARALIVGAASLALAACAEEVQEAAKPMTIVGSSTVYPFAQKVAADTKATDASLTDPVISSTGTSEGIAEFCKGQGSEAPDIVNASRRMTLAEFERCKAAGVADIIEVQIGRDGIVFASAQNKGLDLALTSGAVYRALAAYPFGEEQKATNWGDVSRTLPSEPIIVYGPSESSGTRDALLDVVMMPACIADPSMAALEASDGEAFERNCHAIRSDSAYIEQGEKDDLIVGKISNNPRAVGVFGYSYLEENAEAIKGLTLDGVAPSAQTIADGSYPGSRPLYMYVNKARIGVTPGLIEYLATWPKSWKVNGPLAEIGLVPATDEVLSESASIIAEQITLNADDFASQ